MSNLKLTPEQAERLSIYLEHYEADGSFQKPLRFDSHTDWLVKVQALVKLSRETAWNMAEGNLDKNAGFDLFNVLEITENLLDMYEAIEPLDKLVDSYQEIKKELDFSN